MAVIATDCTVKGRSSFPGQQATFGGGNLGLSGDDPSRRLPV